jgi:tetratricopeptide (TPR) repeat protein
MYNVGHDLLSFRFMNRFFLSTALFGINIALVQSIAHAESKTAEQVNNIAAGITVQIAGGVREGSGVLLQQEGDVYTVLTAGHVVAQGTSFKIKTPDGATHQSLPQTIRRAKNKIDLAVVKFRSSRSYDLAKVPSYSYIQSGEIIYVAGFPAATPTIPSGTLNFTVGNIINDQNRDSEGYSLVYSNFTRWGMSGGPILDQSGELIGIHGKGDQDNRTKTGRNLGIPLKQLIAVAADLGIVIQTYSTTSRPQQQLNSAAAYIQSALLRQEQGDGEGMLEDCNRAIMLEPRNAQAYFLRAEAKVKIYDIFNSSSLSKASDVESDYSQAIRFNPQYAEAYQKRASIRSYSLNNYPGSLSDLNQYVALRPQDVESYASRAYLKEKMNDLPGALADYDKIIALGVPRYPSYNNNNAGEYGSRGSLREKMGDFEGALADYGKAIQLEPQDSGYYFNRGRLKAKLNRLAEALVDYNQGIEINLAAERKASLEYDALRLSRGRASNAEDHEYYQRAVIREKLQDFLGSLADYDYVVKIYKEDKYSSSPAMLLVNRAELKAYKINDIKGALADFDAAIEHMRNLTDSRDGARSYPYAYYSRGYLKATKLNDPDGALEDFNTAIGQFPSYADAYYERGVLKKDKFQFPSGAIKDLTRALELYRGGLPTADAPKAQKAAQRLRELGVAQP